MSKISLEVPSFEHKESYLALVQDFTAKSEKLIPWVMKLDTQDFDRFLNHINHESPKGINLEPNRVPHATYLLVVDEVVVGCSNLRLQMNEFLLQEGGHIGYGIGPSFRKRGYATLLLKKTLQAAGRQHGIERCLIVCDSDNIASEKTIIKNGGVLENETVASDNSPIKRYWIDNSLNCSEKKNQN